MGYGILDGLLGPDSYLKTGGANLPDVAGMGTGMPASPAPEISPEAPDAFAKFLGPKQEAPSFWQDLPLLLASLAGGAGSVQVGPNTGVGEVLGKGAASLAETMLALRKLRAATEKDAYSEEMKRLNYELAKERLTEAKRMNSEKRDYWGFKREDEIVSQYRDPKTGQLYGTTRSGSIRPLSPGEGVPMGLEGVNVQGQLGVDEAGTVHSMSRTGSIPVPGAPTNPRSLGGGGKGGKAQMNLGEIPEDKLQEAVSFIQGDVLPGLSPEERRSQTVRANLLSLARELARGANPDKAVAAFRKQAPRWALDEGSTLVKPEESFGVDPKAAARQALLTQPEWGLQRDDFYGPSEKKKMGMPLKAQNEELLPPGAEPAGGAKLSPEGDALLAPLFAAGKRPSEIPKEIFEKLSEADRAAIVAALEQHGRTRVGRPSPPPAEERGASDWRSTAPLNPRLLEMARDVEPGRYQGR